MQDIDTCASGARNFVASGSDYDGWELVKGSQQRRLRDFGLSTLARAPDTIVAGVSGRSTRDTSVARHQQYDAGWSSPVAREAHNLEVTGSNPVPAIHT